MEISGKDIEKHRAKHPLPFNEITYYSSFEQILGRKPDEYLPEYRYRRWTRNMELLVESGNEMAFEFWGTTQGSDETCFGCVNRDDNRNWCKWSELPCNYNPVIKNLGMACMGLGYDGQQKLF